MSLQRDFVDAVAAPFLRGLAAGHPGLRQHLERLELNRRRWEIHPRFCKQVDLRRSGRRA